MFVEVVSFDHFCWDASSDAIVGDVLSDDAAGGDDAVAADSDARHDLDAEAEPSLCLDDDRSGADDRLDRYGLRRVGEGVVAVSYVDVGGESDFVLEDDLVVAAESAEGADLATFTDLDERVEPRDAIVGAQFGTDIDIGIVVDSDVLRVGNSDAFGDGDAFAVEVVPPDEEFASQLANDAGVEGEEAMPEFDFFHYLTISLKRDVHCEEMESELNFAIEEGPLRAID